MKKLLASLCKRVRTIFPPSSSNLDILGEYQYCPELIEDWNKIFYFLKKSELPNLHLRDIVQSVDSRGLEVTAIEPVMRKDLLTRFEMSLKSLRNKRNDDSFGWEIAFHGTAVKNVGNIIQKGLLMPGRSHVRGIYTSPYASYSFRYSESRSPGVESVPVFVCAVIRGKAYDGYNNTLEAGYDSHGSGKHGEWVVFDESRILPLFVLWVKRSSKGATTNDQSRVKPGCGRKGRYRRIVARAISPSKYKYQTFRGDFR